MANSSVFNLNSVVLFFSFTSLLTQLSFESCESVWSDWRPENCSGLCSVKPMQIRFRLCNYSNSTFPDQEHLLLSDFNNSMPENIFSENSSSKFGFEKGSQNELFNETEVRVCRNKDSSFCFKEKSFDRQCGTRKIPTNMALHAQNNPFKNMSSKNTQLEINSETVSSLHQKRIILGNSAEKYSWPWFAALIYFRALFLFSLFPNSFFFE